MTTRETRVGVIVQYTGGKHILYQKCNRDPQMSKSGLITPTKRLTKWRLGINPAWSYVGSGQAEC